MAQGTEVSSSAAVTAMERIQALELEVAQLRTILQEWMLIGETIVEYSQEHTVH